MNKKISEMSDDELRAAIDRLSATRIPAAPTGKKPKRSDDPSAIKPGKKRARWQDVLDI